MISEGKIPLKVGNETYQTWYKLYGDLKTSKYRPVVALHGPGMSHHFMQNHAVCRLPALDGQFIIHNQISYRPNKILYEKAGYATRLSVSCFRFLSFFIRIPVIFYDQLGNGASSHCPGVPKDFWVPKLFMDELDNLVTALGIHEDFDLLGQSWGGGHLSKSHLSSITYNLNLPSRYVGSRICRLPHP